MTDNEKEVAQALRCCAKGLEHDDACENCKVGEIQDRREYIEFAAANVIERLTAENAALRDCSSCKSKTCKCRECHIGKNAWEWRGAPEEGGKA